MRLRSLLGGGAAAAALAALAPTAGAFSTANVTGAQTAPLGPVSVDAEICRKGTAGCAPGASPVGDGQLMIGYRVSEGAAMPGSVTLQGAGLTLTRRDDYAEALETALPAPAGEDWVGYVSGPATLSVVAAAAPQKVTASIGLPTPADGRAFAGPLEYRVVVGARSASTATASRPVQCGSPADQVVDDTICVLGPDLATAATSERAPTRDLGARSGGGEAKALAGALVTRSFTLDYKGTALGESVVLSTSSAIPGAKVSADPGEATFSGSGERGVDVAVDVPAGTAPGRYAVELVAKVGGHERRASGTVEVLPTPTGVGLLSLTSASPASSWRRSAARGRVTFKGRAPMQSTLNVLLRRRSSASSRGRVPRVSRTAFAQTTVSSGAFTRSVRIAPGLLPGAYDLQVSAVTIDGLALPKTTRRLTLKAPPEGVAKSAYVSLTRRGKAISRITGQRRTIYGRFEFPTGALPTRSKSRTLTVAWYRKGKQVAKPVVKRRSRVVTTFLRNRSGRLPKGTYRAVLKWGPTTVAIASVRIG